MATLTECPDCEKHFVGDVCACGYRRIRDNVVVGPWKAPAWLLAPKPCTREENQCATELVQAVLARRISLDEAQAGLHALFHGRELDES